LTLKVNNILDKKKNNSNKKIKLFTETYNYRNKINKDASEKIFKKNPKTFIYSKISSIVTMLSMNSEFIYFILNN